MLVIRATGKCPDQSVCNRIVYFGGCCSGTGIRYTVDERRIFKCWPKILG